MAQVGFTNSLADASRLAKSIGFQPTSKKAFTLVELMVVVAIISILASLLLPAVSKAKKTAKKVYCLNNEKEMGVAFHLYAGDYDDDIPPNGKPTRTNPTWVQGVFVRTSDQTNSAFLADENFAKFAQYMKSLEIYKCPSDPSRNLRSYAMNNYVGYSGEWDNRLPFDGWEVYQKFASVGNPAGLLMIAGVNHKSICWPYLGVNPEAERWFNFPASDHSGGDNLLFVDGHVDFHKWIDPATRAAESRSHHQHATPAITALTNAIHNPDLEFLVSIACVRKPKP